MSVTAYRGAVVTINGVPLAIGVRWTRNPLRTLPLAEFALRFLAWVLE